MDLVLYMYSLVKRRVELLSNEKVGLRRHLNVCVIILEVHVYAFMPVEPLMEPFA